MTTLGPLCDCDGPGPSRQLDALSPPRPMSPPRVGQNIHKFVPNLVMWKNRALRSKTGPSRESIRSCRPLLRTQHHRSFTYYVRRGEGSNFGANVTSLYPIPKNGLQIGRGVQWPKTGLRNMWTDQYLGDPSARFADSSRVRHTIP